MTKGRTTAGSTKAATTLSHWDDTMATWPRRDNHLITSLPHFDHKEREDDDCGLPEHPIYADYVKYLWKGHTRSGGVQAPNASIENTDNTNER